MSNQQGQQLRDFGERVHSLARWLDERPLAAVGASADVAAQLRESLEQLQAAEEELRTQNDDLRGTRLELEIERQRYLELFEYAPDAYLVTDMNGIVREANLAAQELFHRPPELIVRKPLRLFVPVDDKEPFYQILSTLRHRGRVEDVLINLRTSPRRMCHLSVSARVFPAGGGAPVGIRWQMRDITERVRREEEVKRLNADLEVRVRERTAELERANAAKDEFLGLVSHELKTPIAVIAGNAEVLSRRAEMLSAEQRTDALNDVRDEADRLHRIIENLLVLARLERGQEIGREPLRIDVLVHQRIRDHESRYPNRRITTDIRAALPLVDAAPVYVEQVLRNLISNAEKYSPENADIQIVIEEQLLEVTVCVCDQGGGVPDDEMDRLFTPFYRSPRTENHVAGAGIGLAVCKRLVEAQHGRIWAEKRPEGGMKFCFSLPCFDEGSD